MDNNKVNTLDKESGYGFKVRHTQNLGKNGPGTASSMLETKRRP